MKFYFLSIKEFTWVKSSHSLHCYQIKLIRNIFGSKQDHSSLATK